MSFANGRLAKVWEIRKKDKFTEIKISTSKKKDDGYVQDFSSYVRFIGKAHDKAQDLKGDEMIKMLEVECTNKYDGDKKQMYYNFICWDFEVFESNGSKKDDAKPASDKENHPPLYDNTDDDDLPF